jgi:hypothetical protein
MFSLIYEFLGGKGYESKRRTKGCGVEKGKREEERKDNRKNMNRFIICIYENVIIKPFTLTI